MSQSVRVAPSFDVINKSKGKSISVRGFVILSSSQPSEASQQIDVDLTTLQLVKDWIYYQLPNNQTTLRYFECNVQYIKLTNSKLWLDGNLSKRKNKITVCQVSQSLDTIFLKASLIGCGLVELSRLSTRQSHLSIDNWCASQLRWKLMLVFN